MIGKTEDGNYTPFVPAQELSGTVRYTALERKDMSVHVSSTVEYHFAQDDTAPDEIATPDYWLWSLGGSAVMHGEGKTYEIGLHGNNLLNTAYYDHLSRFKYFSLLNIGRNISLSLKIRFDHQFAEK